jgi:hypothetical protein
LSRLKTLRRLESTLADFIRRAAVIELERMEISDSIERLDGLNRLSLRGEDINASLGDWFSRSKPYLESDRFNPGAKVRIGNLLGEIRRGLDTDDPEGKKLSDEINSWQAKGIVPRRKLVLSRGSEKSDSDITGDFASIIEQQQKEFEYYRDNGSHLLTILNGVLKAAEAKNNKMYLHMAGSIIYYLRINGYKVDPYVRKLRALEKTMIAGDRKER